jgi:eukaryotic translation initiation factor 2C
VYRADGGVVPQPDVRITQLENNILKSQGDPLAGKMAQLTVAENHFPPRPAFGTSGKEVTLWANYFCLQFKPNDISAYTLVVVKEGIEPGVKDPRAATGRKLESIVRSAVEQVKASNPIPLVTEFKSQVVCLKPLKLPTPQIVKVEYTDDGRNTKYDVHFNGPTNIDIGGLNSYINTMHDPSGSTSFPKFADVVTAIGTVLSHYPRSDASTGSLGKGRHYPLSISSEIHSLGWAHFNSVIRGYFQSVRPTTGRLLLNVNVSHGVFRFHGQVSEFMGRYNLADEGQLLELHKALDKLRAKVTFLKDQTVPSKKGKGSSKPSSGNISQKVICGLATPRDGDKNRTSKVRRLGARPTEVEFVIKEPAPAGFKVGESCTVAAYFKKSTTLTSLLPSVAFAD